MQSRKQEGSVPLSRDMSLHMHKSCRPAEIRLRRGKESGFILTLELLLLMTIFGTVIYFGFQMYQKWLVNSIDPMGGAQTVIYDNAGGGLGNSNIITRAEAYNSFDAPVFLSRPDKTAAALLGVRANGFTSRQRVYFDAANCTGNAFLLDPSDTGAQYGPIADLNELEGVAFAIGPNNVLYRIDGTIGGGTLAAGPPVLVSEYQSEAYDNPATGADERCKVFPQPDESDGGANPNNLHSNVLGPVILTYPSAYITPFWAPAKLGSAPGMAAVPGTMPTLPGVPEGQPLPTLTGTGHQPSGSEGAP